VPVAVPILCKVHREAQVKDAWARMVNPAAPESTYLFNKATGQAKFEEPPKTTTAFAESPIEEVAAPVLTEPAFDKINPALDQPLPEQTAELPSIDSEDPTDAADAEDNGPRQRTTSAVIHELSADVSARVLSSAKAFVEKQSSQDAQVDQSASGQEPNTSSNAEADSAQDTSQATEQENGSTGVLAPDGPVPPAGENQAVEAATA
jgi:hypothetical protein